MDALLPLFGDYGIPGLALGLLVWMNMKKDDRINDLTDRLVSKNESDADRFANITLTMERILMAVQEGDR